MNQADAKSVVVGVDGSQAAIDAAEWAIEEARSRQLPLRLVYVIPRHDAKKEWDVERAEMALARAEHVAQRAAKSVEVETAIRSGDPGQALLCESQDAALVCVGTARHGQAPDGLVGPTATALLADAPCPVAIIRGGRRAAPGVIAVVLNDDPDNDEVVHQAMAEGRRRHATVLQIDRRLDSWVRRYPDVRVRTVAAGTGMPTDEKQSGAIELAVVGDSDAAEITALATPNCHPIVGYPDCSVLVVRSSRSP